LALSAKGDGNLAKDSVQGIVNVMKYPYQGYSYQGRYEAIFCGGYAGFAFSEPQNIRAHEAVSCAAKKPTDEFFLRA
jgi:hypothetical protein